MKHFISQIIAGYHHGRGTKYTKKGQFDVALSHFQTALKYAKLSDDEVAVPLEMECIARALVRLGQYNEAKEYAEKSLELYQLQGLGQAFGEGGRRVAELIKTINSATHCKDC